MLDYGCAKAATPQRLLQQRPDLRVHLFDVSEMYAAHWDRFVPQERRAVHHVPAAWRGSFDVLTSFFALEHIPQPRDTVRQIASLLKDEGVFYAIVPDTFGNVADFVVIDHVNHFTAPSLHALLRDAGFRHIDIDAQAHRGALVVVARKDGPAAPAPAVEPVLVQARELAGYWSALAGRIRAAEAARGCADAAIYGSGFYGAYIASTLTRPEQLRCFLDRSPFQQGKSLWGKPVVAPQALPAHVRTLYVGLNPRIARDTMAELDWLRERDVDLVFLDEAAA